MNLRSAIIILPSLAIIFSFFWLTGFAYPVYRAVYLESDTVLQGNTMQVTVSGVRNNAYITCFYKGEEVPLYHSDDHTARGLIGISALEKEGEEKLVIAYRDFWQELKKETLPFAVTKGIFKKERIRFSKKKRKLYKNPKVPKERNKLIQVYQTETPDRLWERSFEWPVERRITSPFGSRRVYRLDSPVKSYHRGVDISAPTGTRIQAANNGKVICAEKMVLAGSVVVIDHGQGVLSIYKHLSTMNVQEGDTVSKGDLIGRSGSGGLSTGAHLHWEMRVHAVPVNPLEWLEKEF